MTLLVGILCADGVVVGSDGAATYGTHSGQPTVRQPTSKLILKKDIIVGVSGFVGLGQRVAETISELAGKNEFRRQSGSAGMTTIRKALWEQHFELEFKIAAASRPLLPAAPQEALTHTLFAVPLRNEPSLFQFTAQGSPEQATHDLPFVTAGSGQFIGDQFLAFLRNVLWNKRKPTLADGVFATVWTLRHAIDINPGGVADPMQVVVLERPHGGEWRARQLTDNELQEHEEHVTATVAALRQFREIQNPKTPSAESNPPPEPKNK